jgi:hypothetical protein
VEMQGVFRWQGILRNRIDDFAVLKPILGNADDIRKLSFDGERRGCCFRGTYRAAARVDSSQHSIVIDYGKGPDRGLSRKAGHDAPGPTRSTTATRFGRFAPAGTRPCLIRSEVRAEVHAPRFGRAGGGSDSARTGAGLPRRHNRRAIAARLPRLPAAVLPPRRRPSRSGVLLRNSALLRSSLFFRSGLSF